MAKGAPFATFLIIGPTCFFLGILFASFPYDYYVLWAQPPQPAPEGHSFPLLPGTHIPGHDASSAMAPYLTRLELHLRFLAASPALISRILHLTIGVGLIGILAKLYRPSEANMLFDGATLVLYICGITVYLANITKGVRAVSGGVYAETAATLEAAGVKIAPAEPAHAAANILGGEGDLMSREDTLKVLAASNTILALVLVGVLVLQAGQWYAQKKERQEIEEMDRAARDKAVTRREKSEAAGGAKESKKVK